LLALAVATPFWQQLRLAGRGQHARCSEPPPLVGSARSKAPIGATSVAPPSQPAGRWKWPGRRHFARRQLRVLAPE